MRAVRAWRMGAVWVLMTGLVLSLAAPAASQGTPTGAPPPQDPLRPGDPRAEQEYDASLRQARPGLSSAQARATALRQAQQLPQATALPKAAEGARPLAEGPQPRGLGPPAGAWQQLGPAPADSNTTNPNTSYQYGRISGRATAVVVGPNTGVIYLGTAGGGVWRSDTDGADWRPLTDSLSSLVVGAIALDPADTTDRTLYVGTGEANNTIDTYAGVGVYKTTDGGANWSLLGQSTFGAYGANATSFTAIAVNGSVVFGATPSGLFRSGDGGANWSRIASGLPNSGNAPCTDVIMDGTNVYAVISSASGSSSSGVYKSTTGGSGGFTALLNGLPAASSYYRSQLAIARSNTQVLYLVVTNASYDLLDIYKTTNGGTSWSATTKPPAYLNEGVGGYGWYDLSIAVDPTNANYVYSGGISLVGSADGGTTWRKIAPVYCSGSPPCSGLIHPYQHAGAFGRSGSPRPFYTANDGGIYKTANPTATTPTWTNLNANLATTMLRAGATTANYLTQPIVIAGALTNGFVRSAAPGLGVWSGIRGGDGGFVAIDPANPNNAFAMDGIGYLYRTTNADAGAAITWSSRNTGSSCGGGVFRPPFVVDPANFSYLARAGQGKVCKSLNGGTYWINENVGTSGTTIFSLAMEPGSTGVRYAGTAAGVFRTIGGNDSGTYPWTACGTGLPATSARPVIALAAAAGGVVYATLGGFGVHNVWKSTNCGAWQDLSGNLPDAPTTSLVQYATSGGGTALIVGTDVGVFLSTNSGTTWSTLTSGLPNTPISQIITDGELTTLFAFTHGRGAWRMDIPGDFTVTGFAPAEGGTSSGNDVTIRGTRFTAGMSVTFDGIPATNVVVVTASRTELRVTAPPHAAGIVAVQVTFGGTTLTVPGGYRYGVIDPAPTPRPSTTGGMMPRAAPTPRPSASPASGMNTPNPAPMRR